MSRQIVINRRGKPIGYIDTSRDGLQSAFTPHGGMVATFDPRVGETFTPTGALMAEGNQLARVLKECR